MLIIKLVKDLQRYINKEKIVGKTVGFIPTMGALHDGHLSLIKKANTRIDITVCSIFVNPTQFNDKKDLKNYPRTVESDIQMLSAASCDVLFLPEVDEIYPPGFESKLDLNFGEMATVMEGKFRPEHFDGMAQVVNRLLEIVDPDQLFMGQKDFQQLSIVGSMLQQQNSKIKLVGCPIIRENHGLAMSSRNRRLTEKTRHKAKVIFETLQNLKSKVKEGSDLETLKSQAFDQLSISPFEAEYLEICDGFTLESVKKMEDHDFIVAFAAVWVENIRLIDNLVIKGEQFINE